jgi:hypothetical protein
MSDADDWRLYELHGIDVQFETQTVVPDEDGRAGTVAYRCRRCRWTREYTPLDVRHVRQLEYELGFHYAHCESMPDRDQEYYDRKRLTHIDGTAIFKSPEDRARERAIADRIEKVWDCKIVEFAALAPIDFYAKRVGRVVGVLELKDRDHTRTEYPTVYLNVRKWLGLLLTNIGLGVPALFVVQFKDFIGGVSVTAVDPKRLSIAGARDNKEPVIEVPIKQLRPLKKKDE